MGFSSQQYRRGKQDRPWKINPIWRGIGCIFILLVPIMAWYGTALFLQTNQSIVLPRELTNVVVIPFTHITEIDKLIVQANHYFQSTNFVMGQLFFTAILTAIGFGVIGFLYSILYRIAGPSRYGPFDVPPNKV